MQLKVYCAGILVGTLDMKDSEPFYGFTYHTEYLASPNAEPLSISFPLQEQRFSGQASQPFLEGLLPEGDVRASLANCPRTWELCFFYL